LATKSFHSNCFVDEQIRIGIGQAKVRRWVEDILPLLTDEDSLEMERVYHRQAACRVCEHETEIA